MVITIVSLVNFSKLMQSVLFLVDPYDCADNPMFVSIVGEGPYSTSNLQSKCVERVGASQAHYLLDEIPDGIEYRECFYQLPCIKPNDDVIIKVKTESGSWEAETGR